MPVSSCSSTPGNYGAAGLLPYADFAVSLPDAFPGNVSFAGNVSGATAGLGGVGQVYAPVALSDGSGGTSLALPAVPGSGTTYATLQTNTSTGVCSWKTDPGAYPAADTGCLALFTLAIPSTATAPWACVHSVVS